MVCQAASQTRFRALKHESGIIVRVIACFQPLDDCQVTVLIGRKWVQICQQCSLSKGISLEVESRYPYLEKKELFHLFTIPNTMVSANGSLQGLAVPILPYLKKSQGNEVGLQRIFESSKMPQASAGFANESLHGLAVPLLPHLKAFQGFEGKKWFYCGPYYGPSPPDIVHKEKLSTDKHVAGATPNVALGSVQKRFFVFDQSGNETKLIYSSLVAAHASKQSLENGSLVNQCGSPQKASEAIKDPITCHIPVLDDQHLLSNEESEMHEDTEELDALLYSDDSHCDDDETSTAHSPSEEDAEEVTSHFDSTKRKRQRDEADEQSLLRDTGSSLDSSEYEDDADSNYVNRRVEATPNKRAKRDTIRDSVKILQNIIPGGKGKNTALTLDDAIKYLKFLKHKAESLGVAIS